MTRRKVIFPPADFWTNPPKENQVTTNGPSETAVIVALTRDFRITHHLTDSGNDLIGICVEDEQIGELALMLTKEQAQRVATRLTALLCALPEVREAKKRQQGEEQ